MKFYRDGKYVGYSREEFACKCGCGFNTVDTELLDVLIDLKHEFNYATVLITSGNRCESHNESVGGAKASQHMISAADLKVCGVNPDTVYNYLDNKYSNKYGVGKYNSRTHIDIREDKARWDNTRGDMWKR